MPTITNSIDMGFSHLRAALESFAEADALMPQGHRPFKTARNHIARAQKSAVIGSDTVAAVLRNRGEGHAADVVRHIADGGAD